MQSKNERELKAKVKKPWKEKQTKKTLLSRCGELRGRHEKGDYCFPLVFFVCSSRFVHFSSSTLVIIISLPLLFRDAKVLIYLR